jgi:hypothetical protein
MDGGDFTPREEWKEEDKGGKKRVKVSAEARGARDCFLKRSLQTVSSYFCSFLDVPNLSGRIQKYTN